ncbi:CotH kinase family protein [Spirochaeta africana]|uniref:Spore coat assembly protein n=1 Tax=Spirochaeta africana (strain ATCC 700263 / DSM 8902 / Z-7692) TaxID=889378 RepID=H9UMA4_SPIAZ|nr:CotH kinase family protein [Spirochaeta africana]AFG38647.1 spore coat assembly protein [Spirochaeta africana DSM 8902]
MNLFSRRCWRCVFLLAVLLLSGCDAILLGPFRATDGSYATQSGPDGPAQSDYIFDLDALPVITIRLVRDEYDQLIQNFRYNSLNEHYVRGGFSFEKNGRVDPFYGEVGVRTRGNTSRALPQIGGDSFDPNAARRNAHFRISFNSYVDGGRFYGLRNMILKWHNQDPSYAREILAYDLFNRFGVTAPRASYARVYLQVTEPDGSEIATYAYGVYAMIESVDRSFYQERFDDNLGYSWKSLYTSMGPASLTLDSIAGDRIGQEYKLGSPGENYAPIYDFKHHNPGRGVRFSDARDELEEFVRAINILEGAAFERYLRANMNVEGLLRAYAVNMMLGQWDGYWVNGNNYYLYQDSRGIWHYIPWDYDNIFGTGTAWFDEWSDIATRDIHAWGRSDQERPLMDKVMARDSLRDQLFGYIEELIDPDHGLFHAQRIAARVQSWHDNLELHSYVHPDYVEVEGASHNNHHQISDTAYASHTAYRLLDPASPENFVRLRAESARQQLDGSWEGSPELPDPGDPEPDPDWPPVQHYISPEITDDEVIFRFEHDGEVRLRGELNGWADDDPLYTLTPDNSDGNMQDLTIPRTDVLDGMRYKFYIVGSGEWITDPANPEREWSGDNNSIVRYE